MKIHKMTDSDLPPQSEEVRWCSRCRDDGISSTLRFFHINLTEQVLMCSNKTCTFPLGSCTEPDISQTNSRKSTYLLKRKAPEHDLDGSKRRKCPQLKGPSLQEIPNNNNIPVNYKAGAQVLPVNKVLPHRTPEPVHKTETLNTQVIDVIKDSQTSVVTTQAQDTHFVDDVGDTDIIEPFESSICHQPGTPKPEPTFKPEIKAQPQCGEKTCNRPTGHQQYLHWWNKDALCWLDVAMCILVHSQTVRRLLSDVSSDQNLASCVVKAFDKAQHTVNGTRPGKNVLLETSVGMVTVKTGGGDVSLPAGRSVLNPVTPTPIKAQDTARARASEVLDAVREVVWQKLQPKLKCPRGDNDSPVFALPLILRESAPLMQTFMVHYRWEMSCTECGYEHTDSVMRCMPTFPNVTSDFKMTQAAFLRDCFMCPASNQRMKMRYSKLPPVLMVHFVEGLPRGNYASYDFEFGNCRFAVSAIIQYKNNPDHFVAWIRNRNDDTWMEVDDLRKSSAGFVDVPPTFPPSQVHIVMWEQVDASSSVVRDKLQASSSVTTVSVARSALSQPVMTVPSGLARTSSIVSRLAPSRKPTSDKTKTPTLLLPTVVVSSDSKARTSLTSAANTSSIITGKPTGISPIGARALRPSQLVMGARPLQGASTVVPCTNSSLSRLERLKENAARLKALKKNSATPVSSLLSAAPGLSNLPGTSGSKNPLPRPSLKTSGPSHYMDVLQPYIQKTAGKTALAKTLTKPVMFQGFSFGNNVRSMSAVDSLLSKIALDPPPKQTAPALVPIKKSMEDSVQYRKASGKRQSRTSLRAGVVVEGDLNAEKTFSIHKGKGKSKPSSKSSADVDGCISFVRGDPAAPKKCDKTETNRTPNQPEISRINEIDSTAVTRTAGIDTNVTSLLTSESTHAQPLKPGPQVLGKTDTSKVDKVSESPKLGQVNPILDIFDDAHFGANIDFTDLNFNLDDFLV